MKTIFAPQPSVQFEELGPGYWIDDSSGQILDGSPGPQRLGVEQGPTASNAYPPAALLTQLTFRFAPRQGSGGLVVGGRAVCACSNVGRVFLATGGEP
jgi:hypothetical protein